MFVWCRLPSTDAVAFFTYALNTTAQGCSSANYKPPGGPGRQQIKIYGEEERKDIFQAPACGRAARDRLSNHVICMQDARATTDGDKWYGSIVMDGNGNQTEWRRCEDNTDIYYWGDFIFSIVVRRSTGRGWNEKTGRKKKIIDRRSCENRRTLKVQGNHLKKKSVNKVSTSCRFIYLFVFTAKYVYKFNKGIGVSTSTFYISLIFCGSNKLMSVVN